MGLFETLGEALRPEASKQSWQIEEEAEQISVEHGYAGVVRVVGTKDLRGDVATVFGQTAAQCQHRLNLITNAPELRQAAQNALDDLDMFGKLNGSTVQHLKKILDACK